MWWSTAFIGRRKWIPHNTQVYLPHEIDENELVPNMGSFSYFSTQHLMLVQFLRSIIQIRLYLVGLGLTRGPLESKVGEWFREWWEQTALHQGDKEKTVGSIDFNSQCPFRLTEPCKSDLTLTLTHFDTIRPLSPSDALNYLDVCLTLTVFSNLL